MFWGTFYCVWRFDWGTYDRWLQSWFDSIAHSEVKVDLVIVSIFLWMIYFQGRKHLQIRKCIDRSGCEGEVRFALLIMERLFINFEATKDLHQFVNCMFWKWETFSSLAWESRFFEMAKKNSNNLFTSCLKWIFMSCLEPPKRVVFNVHSQLPTHLSVKVWNVLWMRLHESQH